MIWARGGRQPGTGTVFQQKLCPLLAIWGFLEEESIRQWRLQPESSGVQPPRNPSVPRHRSPSRGACPFPRPCAIIAGLLSGWWSTFFGGLLRKRTREMHVLGLRGRAGQPLTHPPTRPLTLALTMALVPWPPCCLLLNCLLGWAPSSGSQLLLFCCPEGFSPLNLYRSFSFRSLLKCHLPRDPT